MYERLRCDFAAILSNHFKTKDINIILASLDSAAVYYDISEKSTALMVTEDIFPATAKAFLTAKALEGLSPTSVKNYKIILRVLFEYIHKTPQDITTNDIRLFLATYKAQKGVSERTLEKYRQIIRNFFNWAYDEEYITKNPCRTIRPFKFEIVPRRSLDRDSLEILRRSCSSKRDMALIDVMYSTACRVSEVANMKKSDISPDGKSVHIIGKGSKHNTVYLNTNARLSLKDYLESRNDNSDYLFVEMREPHNKLSARTIEHIFSRLSEKVGFKVTPHIIRHTTATLSLQAGMPITQVQKLLNHSSVATTQIYAETLQDDVRRSHELCVV